MKRNFKIWALMILAIYMSGCTHTPETVDESKADLTQTQFERGIKMLDQERYAEAEKIFNKILVQSPASEFDFIILFNLGSAREGRKDCAGAADTYKKIARASLGRFPRIETQSLLRLSYTYECLGQDEKAIVALLDVRRRAKFLHEDTVKAELPARLAAAYARSGNRPEAEKYFREALNGIKFLQVKYKESKKLADTLAESLYFMGRSNVSESEFLRQPISQVRGLGLTQLYLLQSAELGSARWSRRAVDDIISHYELVWKYMDKLSPIDDSDKAIGEHQLKALKGNILVESLRSVRALRAQRIPRRDESLLVKNLFEELTKQEARITSALSDIGVSNDLTPQSSARQGLKREGRVRSKQPSELEKKAGAGTK
jgi:tetratricopeptide (TPR) repeat protein